jgi:hypothetical protein
MPGLFVWGQCLKVNAQAKAAALNCNTKPQ